MKSGVVVWVTGLPSSGKSKLAREVRDHLKELGLPSCVLDGDVMRQLLFPQLGYSEDERSSFYSSLAQLAAELSRQELVVLVPATAHRNVYRRNARLLAPRFIEVWVTTPLEECRRRDDKGLYAAADAMQANEMPGRGASYEAPDHADLQATGGNDMHAVRRIVQLIIAGA